MVDNNHEVAPYISYLLPTPPTPIFLGLDIYPPPPPKIDSEIGPDNGTIEFLQIASLKILCWRAG